jgi:hypothetical protein
MLMTPSDSSRQRPDHHDRQIVFCLDGQVVTIHEEYLSSGWDGGRADITVGHAAPHRLVFPGWQELRFALETTSPLLFWSARDLFVLDVRADSIQRLFQSDEDIRFVHPLADGLLLMCETSLRTVNRAGQQVSRLELPGVAETVSLSGLNVTVSTAEGGEWRATLNRLHLAAAFAVSG